MRCGQVWYHLAAWRSKSLATLIDDIRDADVQDSLIERTVGHEDSAVTFSIYGSRSPLKAMAEALHHIEL
jgi:hypothetical protein